MPAGQCLIVALARSTGFCDLNSHDLKKPPKKLAARRFVLTAEVTPPVSFDRADLLAKALPLKGLADAVNVTDGAGARPHLAAVTAAAMLVAEGIEPILQFTCRDRNRIALQSDLMAAAASGVRNLLMLRGDDPSAGDQPDAKPVFDLDPRQLLETARRFARQGRIAVRAQGRRSRALLPRRRRQSDRSAARLGAEGAGGQARRRRAIHPDPVLHGCRHRAPLHGAACRARPCRQAFMLIGVVPLRSAKSARWIRDKLYGAIIPDAIVARMEGSSDPAAEGRRICVEVIQELADIPHVAGCHIMAPNHEEAVPPVITAARESIARLAK